jgi:hypothetical protein
MIRQEPTWGDGRIAGSREDHLMPFVICAQRRAKPGEEDRVLGILRTIAAMTWRMR